MSDVAVSDVVDASGGASGRRRAPWLALALVALMGCVEPRSSGRDGAAGDAAVAGGILLAQEDLYAVDVVDSGSAWIVGSYGTVLRLSARGAQADLLPIPSEAPLFATSFRTPSDGLVAGRQGTMFRTRDAGAAWEKLELPGIADNVLAMARSPDGESVWAVGPRGMILRSRDSGAAWNDLSLARDVTLNGVAFLDEREGWIVGEFGTILHTDDGGDAWAARNRSILGLPKYVEPGVSEEVALRVGIPELFPEDLYVFDVAFTAPERGYAVAAGGFLLETADRGETWAARFDLTRNTLLRVRSIGESPDLLAVGILGTFARFEDGRWKLLDEISERLFTWIRDVDFSDDGSFGVAVGGKASILLSSDGGRTWTALDRGVLARAAEAAAGHRGGRDRG